MAASVVIDKAAFQSSIDWHINRVASQHETALRAEAVMPGLIGKDYHIEPTANSPAVAVAIPQQLGAAA